MAVSTQLTRALSVFALMVPASLGCSASDSTNSGNGASAGSGANSGTTGDNGTTGGAGNAGGGPDGGSFSGKPNIVLIFADDMGWGDLGAFGSTTNPTPHLDRLAQEGQRWTDFYVTSSVCSPSRAALLTGRFQVRTGMYGLGGTRVATVNSSVGLPAEEVTIAEVLKSAGYATGMFGKWHLGDAPQFLPTRQGFDTYFGVPYSHDMSSNIPLLDGESTVETLSSDEQLSLLTKRFTEQAIQFVRDHSDEPFFLYLPHTAPHVPILPSAEFKGKSGNGDYADVIMELDHYTGELVQAIEDEGIAERTLIIFTNDNGPWLHKDIIAEGHAGTPAPFEGGKFQTYEGSFRVPTIMHWPGTIPAGDVAELAQTIDLLPTFASLAGVSLSDVIPDGVTLDGFDLSPALMGTGASPRETVLYWSKDQIDAYRKNHLKVFQSHPQLVDVTLANGCVRDIYAQDLPCWIHDDPLRESLKAERAALAESMKAEIAPPAFDNQ